MMSYLLVFVLICFEGPGDVADAVAGDLDHGAVVAILRRPYIHVQLRASRSQSP